MIRKFVVVIFQNVKKSAVINSTRGGVTLYPNGVHCLRWGAMLGFLVF